MNTALKNQINGETELARNVLLLAEDNDDDAAILKEVFSRQKFLRIVDVARDGEEALAYLHEMINQGKQNPDLVILDINMPRKNGFEVLDEMKKDLRLKKIPVIMLTCSERQEDINRAYQTGAATYFTKPMTLETYEALAEVLNYYWGRYAKMPSNPI